MNAINTCWYRALEKLTVYTEFLLWLQDYSGCLVLRLCGTPPLITQGNEFLVGVEKLGPSRAAHHQGGTGMCQGSQSLQRGAH